MKDKLIQAIEAGHSAILACGNIKDYVIEDNRIIFRPWYIAEALTTRNYMVLQYSRSTGLFIHNYSDLSKRDRDEIDSLLRVVGLEPIIKRERPNNISEEIIQVFRGLTRLLLLSNVSSRFKIAAIIDYSEHLAPNLPTGGTDDELFVAECLHALAVGPALKKSGNVVICYVREGLQNPLLNDMTRVEYSYPNEAEIMSFAMLAEARAQNSHGQQYGRLAGDLTLEEFSRLTRGIRIRDLDTLFRSAARQNIQIDRKQILQMKIDSVLSASEGTLSLAQTDISLEDIVGLEVPKRILQTFSEKLKAGDPSAPRCVGFVGPPGTAKSTFAVLLGKMAGYNVLQFDLIKNMYVGESERLLKLALKMLEDMQPSILLIDEMTEMVPSRREENLDSGVSKNFLAQLLNFSAREDLRGRCLIVGTSNFPSKLDPAILDRFIFIPFLPPTPDEIVKLFGVFEKRITKKQTLHIDVAELKEAADLLFQKSASPRKIYDIVNHALLFSSDGALKPDTLLRAAQAFTGVENPYAVAYSSLESLKLASFKDYYPWAYPNDLNTYQLPWYLEGLVDQNGHIDEHKLQTKQEEYRRLARI
ncbi:MAG: ATP-binding protein [candidate division KSB1 bacterium]|nr:ATP-binding protein [candidate division KSB1 bacterium]MDQ7063517.1 ATP-binding protein [candidate division KSB1 bacterium]